MVGSCARRRRACNFSGIKKRCALVRRYRRFLLTRHRSRNCTISAFGGEPRNGVVSTAIITTTLPRRRRLLPAYANATSTFTLHHAHAEQYAHADAQLSHQAIHLRRAHVHADSTPVTLIVNSPPIRIRACNAPGQGTESRRPPCSKPSIPPMRGPDATAWSRFIDSGTSP